MSRRIVIGLMLVLSENFEPYYFCSWQSKKRVPTSALQADRIIHLASIPEHMSRHVYCKSSTSCWSLFL